MLCNYIFQNIVVSIFMAIVLYFLMRKSPMPWDVKSEKSKKQGAFESWGDTQGWIAVIFIPIIITVSMVEKIPSLSIILSIFGIQICGYVE